MLRRALLLASAVGLAPLAAAADQVCDGGKAATAPMSRFKDGGSGTVIDSQNKRVWLRCSLGMSWSGGSCEGQSLSYSWSGAADAVAELNAKRVGGHDDWRLPTVDELNSIVEKQCFGPAISLEAFPFSPESGFWSASAAAGNNPRAWIVHFLHGQQYIANKDQSWRVRPVAGK